MIQGRRISFLLLLASYLLLKTAAGAEGNDAVKKNLIPNASFTEMDKGKLAEWTAHTVDGDIKFENPDATHLPAAKSVSIASENGGRGHWYCDLEVKPFSKFKLTAWVKAGNVSSEDGDGAFLTVDAPTPVVSRAIVGSCDWTEISVEFETRLCDTARVNCILGAQKRATGTVLFNDLRLECVASEKMEPQITIKSAKAGAPVSKYIYGQFIEHLGRCIYGGIWAEMLQDRKFFFKVGDKESPWTPFPKDSAVEMCEDGAFVGVQTPETYYGLIQGELSLRAGKEYVGYIYLSGEPNRVGFVHVGLLWGDGPDNHQQVATKITENWTKMELRFRAGGDTDAGRLGIASGSSNHSYKFRVGAVSLMPADNVKGMRADTLALLKELNAPVYRWPGGNFVSGYNWRDGIGDRDKRPPRKNLAWKGIEANDFGLDEFMVFCREIDTEPYIAVNTGLGNAEDAVAELEYANGAADTPMGKLRAQNGHPEPYGAHWWGVGNEMYGDWQLGHMPLAEYVKKHNAFAEALRAVDPTINLIAVGATGEWSKTMLSECAANMDLLSEHIYVHDKTGPLSHSRLLADGLHEKVEAHRGYLRDVPALADRKIPIALDEWNYWYGPQIYGELGTRYFLKDALGIAAGLHEYIRNSDIFQMANYAQTVNVIGAIKTTKTDAAFETTGLVLKLYRNHFGTAPVAISGDAAPLDVVAAWTEDHKALTIAVVNATRKACALKLKIADAKLAGNGTAWIIAGDDPMLSNEPGKEPSVKIVESSLTGVTDTLDIPSLSAGVYLLTI